MVQNTDIASAEGQTQTPAQQLGLPEHVNVLRSSGALEGGWHVAEITHTPHHETNEPTTYVRVDSQDAQGKVIYKRVPLDDLQSWNIIDDDDTLPAEDVRVFSEDMEPSQQELLMAPDSEVVEEVGETALDGAEVVEASSAEPVAEFEVSEPEVSVTEMEAVEVDPERLVQRQIRAMAELRNEWGWDENITTETAITILDSEHARLGEALHALIAFDRTRQSATQAIHQTEQGRGIVYLGNKTKESLDQFINGAGLGALTNLTSEALKTLPPQLRRKVEMFSGDLRLLRGRYTDMTREFTPNSPKLAMGDAHVVASILGSRLPELQNEIKMANTQVEEVLIDLRGYGAYIQAVEQKEKSGEVTYRNEQVKSWAKELLGEVTEERLNTIIFEMEAAVRLENGMVDDPNSPRLWFGDRVRRNTNKERSRVDITGRRDLNEVPSQKYVAELMADIMRGKFPDKFKKDKGDEIVLNKAQVGGVTLGQHRAAALAMIFGNEWPKLAHQIGFENIENEN